MDLTVLIYHITQRFPNSETYRLVSQMTRSAVSVPAKYCRRSRTRYSARLFALPVDREGIIDGTETYVMLSERLSYVQQAEVRPTLELIAEISKMITAIRGKLVEQP